MQKLPLQNRSVHYMQLRKSCYRRSNRERSMNQRADLAALCLRFRSYYFYYSFNRPFSLFYVYFVVNV